MSDTNSNQFRSPPVGLGPMLMAMGPAIVVTGSVIGSGELINVPKQAATFGFVLFWAVIISCVIKYFLQVELGRFCLVHNQTTIQAFNNCPGPKFRGTSWVGILYMFGYTASMVTLTGILGATAGIFQDLMPLENILPLQQFVTSSDDPSLLGEALRIASKNIWAGLTLLVIMLILWRGLYGELEKLVTILVAGFSLSVVLALFLVQTSPYSLSANDVFSGLKFSLGSVNREAAAFAVVSLLGALGTTANELFMYPYWILEKGYAQHLGPRDSDGWVERARGWLRVLRLDTASATLLATVITAAYYLVASAVLHERVVRNEMKVPEGMDVVKQISAIFTEIYGPWSYWIFMFGGFCTLFSTLVVVTAATGRMWSDLLSSMGWIDWENESSRRRCNRTFQTIYLTAFLLIEVFVNIPPGQRVIIGQYINGLVNTPLIMFGICWLAFHTDRRVRMSRFTAAMLFATMAVILTCLGVGLAV